MATGNISKNMVLLWTNPNPTSAFAAQNFQIDLTEFSFFAIEFLMAHNREENLGISFYKVTDGLFHRSDYLDDTGNNFMRRDFTYSTSNKVIAFQSGYYNRGVENSVVIPYRIYGIK